MIVPLTKIAIIRNASTDDVVRLSNINSGVDGASEFGYSMSENESSIRDNQPNLISNTHQLDIRTLEDEGSQEYLDNWTRDNSEVYISGITLDGFFLWGDKQTTTGEARLYKNYQYDGRRSNKIFARSDEVPGFDADTGIYNGGVWAGNNGIGMYEWDDKGGNNVADGWVSTGYDTTSFSSGQQTIESTSSGNKQITKDIYFPFEGEQLTFSLTVDSFTSPDDNFSAVIYFFNASDGIITSSSSTITSTGRETITATTPANVVSIGCVLNLNASTTNTHTLVFSDPMLSRTGSTTYTKF